MDIFHYKVTLDKSFIFHGHIFSSSLDNFCKDINLIPPDPIIFSQVTIESFDYGHGLKPMTSAMIPAKKESESKAAVKVFDYSHRGDRGSPHGERGYLFERNGDRLSRDRGPLQRDRNRDREKDRDVDRERDRDRSRKDNRDFRDRDYDNRDRDRDRDRDLKRNRDWDRDRYREDTDRDRHREDSDREKRFKWDNKTDTERNSSKERSAHASNQKKESNDEIKPPDVQAHFKTPAPLFKNEINSEVTLIEDLLIAPKRQTRPKQLVIILRGLPGSGKTYVAKLIKDKEIENGGSAPRILSLDDYFMVEKEVTDIDPDTGKRIKRKEFKFEFECGMEEAYRSSLFKSFKKTIDDRFFPFIIVDAIHEKSKQYEQYWSYAKQRGFQVYIAEMDCKDPIICHKRNIHNRSLEAITKILDSWEPQPRHFMSIDIRSILQDVAITEVEMEVESNDKDDPDEKYEDLSSSADDIGSFHIPSRWEKLEATEEKLDQLDGLRVSKKKHSSMEDYLQLPDDYEERKCEPGKKRVRWADLEERKEQDRLRAIGFVVGQTDWNKMTDPSHADRALTRTKLGDLSLCDKLRRGRPHAVDDEALLAVIEEGLTCGELAKQFNVSDETVRLHLHLSAVGTYATEGASTGESPFLHDNPRHHFARVVRDTMQRLGCFVPSSYSLTVHHPITTSSTPWTIIVENFSIMKQTCAKHSQTSLRFKPPSFYHKGIAELETRWQKELDANGDYFED
ncbi:YLP motif-containing protein 1 [Nephila pilipes]|uniref:YLP motif-containing protein 1 n=1 Tax=Nephila pilipes TaxID=299642 RepID=A0A8X6U6V2_NEPPI|nr:YLP motif-containing protein 1 [Nephila pilipes]